ncbi:MAG: alpha/beta hydrolase family protein [Alphaproteobacteria bacterium]
MQVEDCAGTIVSIADGDHQIDALLRLPEDGQARQRNTPVLLRLHGLLGNLLDETEHYLPTALARRGYASITMNTALANLGLFYGFGMFDDVMPQIDAVCDYLRSTGFEKIVLAGHGLGGAIAIRYAAARNDAAVRPELCGLIAIAAPFSLPETIRRRWLRSGAEPSYEEMRLRAGQAKETGWSQDETVVIRKARGPTRRPEHSEIYTLKTWWTLAGPEASGARACEHIGGVKVPVLLVSGEKDEIVEMREGEELSKIARSAGNPDVTHVLLPADHRFDGKHAELSETVIRWLAERHGG